MRTQTQPSSQSYLLRMQGFLRPIRTGNSGSTSSSDPDTALETAENGGQLPENHNLRTSATENEQ